MGIEPPPLPYLQAEGRDSNRGTCEYERRDPEIIDSPRRRRIASGSGVQPNDVSGLVKTFKRSRDMMKALSGGKLGGLKSLFSGGLNMDTLGAAMAGGKKIKQRSKRKRIIKRKGKIKRR